MNAVEVSDDDLIYLNVGGQKLATTRSTLCQVEGSLIASMFNGDWDGNQKRDKDGAVFLDYDPQYFVPILNYLRAKTFATPENRASLPRVPQDQIQDFKNFVQYLGLGDEIFPTEKFNLHSPGVSLEEDGKVAFHSASSECRYVLGENVYHQQIINLKLKVESFQDSDWMFVGVLKGDVVPPDNHLSHKWPGSYGWALGFTGEVWEDGSFTCDDALEHATAEGDTVELVLDCDAGKLSLNLPTAEELHVEIPNSQTWRLNVNLFNPNDKIRIMNE